MAAPITGKQRQPDCSKLAYNPGTGAFVWAVARCRPHKGSIAGWRAGSGYWVITLGGVKFYAHRLAWLISHGVWPAGDIDHINGKRSDNRLVNLRDVSHAENGQNRWHAASNKLSCSLLGVSRYSQNRRWRATIMVRGVYHHIGCFDTPERAHEAYLTAKARLHIRNPAEPGVPSP